MRSLSQSQGPDTGPYRNNTGKDLTLPQFGNSHCVTVVDFFLFFPFFHLVWVDLSNVWMPIMFGTN